MASINVKRDWWSLYRCTTGVDVRAGFFGRFPVRAANREVEECVNALEQAHIGSGYVPTPGGYIGSKRWCPTGIAGKTCEENGDDCSPHNYCIAWDVEYNHNGHITPYRLISSHEVFVTYRNHHKYTAEQVAAIEGVKTVDGKQLFKWLGWIRDFMHWELDVAPEDVSVDWGTVPDGVPPVQKPDDLEVVYMLPILRKGDGLVSRAFGDRVFLSQEVAALQAALRVEGYVEDGTSLDPVCNIDSNFWDGLEGVVKQFQSDNGLAVDGIAGEQTYTALFG